MSAPSARPWQTFSSPSMERGRANSRAPGKLARAIRTSRLILPWATIRPCVSSTDFTGDDSRDTNQKLTAIQGSVICRNCRRSGRSPRSGQRSTLPVRRLGSGPSGAWTQIMGTFRRRAASAKTSMAGPAGPPSLLTNCSGGDDWKPTRKGLALRAGTEE